MYSANSGTQCAFIPASVSRSEVRQYIHAVHQDNHHDKVVPLRVPFKKMQARKCVTAKRRRGGCPTFFFPSFSHGDKDQAPSRAMHICGIFSCLVAEGIRRHHGQTTSLMPATLSRTVSETAHEENVRPVRQFGTPPKQLHVNPNSCWTLFTPFGTDSMRERRTSPHTDTAPRFLALFC